MYQGHRPAFPNGTLEGPYTGKGRIRTVTGAVPAVNADAVDAVPTNAFWNLLSYSIVLVTDGNAANRSVALIVDDGTLANRRFQANNVNTQAASLTRTWFFSQGNDLTTTASGTLTDTQVLILVNLLPPGTGILNMPSGYRVRTKTTSLQATDQYAGPIMTVEEYIAPT
jgi:hypothetical protein